MSHKNKHKQAIAEDHNRQYQNTTAQEDEELARGVIELIQAELTSDSLSQWVASKKCIENRVMKSLGLQSKYRSDGSLR